MHRHFLRPRTPLTAVLAALLAATTPLRADVLVHQSFTLNTADAADRDGAPGVGYGLVLHRGPKAQDHSQDPIVHPEASRPAPAGPPAQDLEVPSPHRDGAKADAGLVRLTLAPGEPVLLLVRFELAIAVERDLRWEMVFGNDDGGPTIFPAIRCGRGWYVQSEGVAVSGVATPLSVAVAGPDTVWRRVNVHTNASLTFTGETLRGPEFDCDVLAAGFYAVNQTDGEQTVRTDTWRLTGTPVGP